MKNSAVLDKIDLHLIKVLHTVLTERSVSRAAVRLGMHQPAVSAMLKRLRELSGDPLLVRSGASMVPTDQALRMVEPAASILRAAELLFSDERVFDPQTARNSFRIAASDYLDPLFLPQLVSQLKAQAPLCQVEIHGLSAGADYRAELAGGRVDVVIGNWLQAAPDLHLSPLFDDEIVSLVSSSHPAARRGWSAQDWLEAEHIAPMPTHPGARGVIDELLQDRGLRRNITARCPYFGLLPAMVASSLLVLTTGRLFCERYLQSPLPHSGAKPGLQILPCPIEFPPMRYYQLWHERTHHASASVWLRERVKAVAASLPRLPSMQQKE